MAQVHATVGMVLIGGAVLFTLAAAVAVLAGGGTWLEGVRVAFTTAVGIQVTLGVVSFVDGDRPAEALHFVYGIAALAVVPFTSFFAAEAPPRSRAKVLGVAGILALGLLWRSGATG